MDKIKKGLIGILITVILLLIPISQMANNIEDPINTETITNDETKAVNIVIWNDQKNLFIEYDTINGWYLSETSEIVIVSYLNLTPTANYKLNMGKFEFINKHDPAVEIFTQIIPLAESWAKGTEISIAAHAVVIEEINVFEWQDEKGWVKVYDYDSRIWSTYFDYIIQ